MAMAKTDGTVIEIEGKFAGNIFRKDQCGQHIQAAPRHIRRIYKTPQQKAFNQSKIAWSNHEWTDEEIRLWWIWCDQHPMKNKKGETRYFHPFIAFLSVNIKRILDDKEIIILPE